MSEEAIEQVAQPEATPTMLETPAEVASGGSGNDFLNMIPEDLRDHPSISPIKDVQNLARSYVNAQRLIGADKVPLPANPTDEDLDNIYSRLGRPESPSQYEIAIDGNVITEDVATQYADVAHQLRLTPEQAQGVLEYYKSNVAQGTESMQQFAEQQAEQVASELQKEWGQAYDNKVSAAQSLINEFADESLLNIQLADGTKVGNNAAFIKAFAAMGEFRNSVISEDTITDGARNTAFTPNQAQAELDAIYGNQNHAYFNKKDPGHDNAVGHVQNLMGMIHG